MIYCFLVTGTNPVFIRVHAAGHFILGNPSMPVIRVILYQMGKGAITIVTDGDFTRSLVTDIAVSIGKHPVKASHGNIFQGIYNILIVFCC